MSSRFSPAFFLSRCKFSTPTITSTYLYSGVNTLYAQNPVFEIVHDESVKVYPHMYNGNAQQNPLYVESRVTKELSMSPRFLPAFFYPDANSVLLRAHLCTAVDSTRRKPGVCNCSRKREGLYNGNVQQNPLCVESCVTQEFSMSPRFSPAFFYSHTNSVLLRAHLCTAVNYMRRKPEPFMRSILRCKFSTPTINSTYLYSGITTP